jgi:Flp pilus assembly protein TadD
MMGTPCLVSVVIPCYNAGPFLARAIQSIHAQGIPQTEIVVVDDCSTDDSRKVCESLALQYPGVRLLRMPANAGPAAARNRGLRDVRGRYICFLDADDEYLPGFFARVVPQLEADLELAAITTSIKLIDCHRDVHPVQFQAIVDSLPSNLMVRKAAADVVGGFPEHPQFRGPAAGEDISFRKALVTWFKVARCDEPFLRHHVREGSHLDYFLDRSKVASGRIVFTARPGDEDPAARAAAQREYLDQVRDRASALAFVAPTLARLRAIQPGPAHSPAGNASRPRGDATALIDRALTDWQGESRKRVEQLAEGLRKAPDNADALHSLGLLFAEQGRDAEAACFFEQAARVRPDLAAVHNNLGVVLKRLGRLEEAEQAYLRASILAVDYYEAKSNLGHLYDVMGRLDEAEAILRPVAEAHPNYAAGVNNLGKVQARRGQLVEAHRSFAAAVAQQPTSIEMVCNLAHALSELGRFEEAARTLHEAERVRPNEPMVLHQRAIMHYSSGDMDAATTDFEHILKLNQHDVEAHLHRSMLWLAQGDMARGWTEYEWRLQRSPRGFTAPRWDGSPIAGKTILIHAEQGLGDTLHFVRYAALVKDRGATVALECQPALRPLLARCPGVDRLAARGEVLPRYDLHAPLLSLPGIFKTTMTSIPNRVPYLAADPKLEKRWKRELERTRGFKIGIAWKGNLDHPHNCHRSLPLATLAPLARIPGVQLFSLQRNGTDEIRRNGRVFPVTDLAPRLDRDGAFMDTAAVLKSLDLVISVDTAIAHLAGALAVPVWVALNIASDWRWFRERTDSPWYPTLRLFRQQRWGDWDDVVAQMAFQLQRQQTAALPPQPILLELTPGELLDRFARLQVKCERGENSTESAREANELSRIAEAIVGENEELRYLFADLKLVRASLGELESRLRKPDDDAKNSDDTVLTLCRDRDRCAALQKRINELVRPAQQPAP